ncbi:hypothetical protein M514_02874 [Trichuris suis]|uniref:Uncharacterized protein n=1 Tax=Trichuris suis TaxID=68888 RepID=A0A085NAX7_9BILA|nr:hypothetical protein M513_02874 [Trichuris suis]KFD66623.1 hypothetical protein M514_02874 [Trichuris suis]
MKPSHLYTQLEILYPDDVDRPIVREMFLKRLPLPLMILCREWLKTHALAETAYLADAHFPLQTDFVMTSIAAPSGVDDSHACHCSEHAVAATRLSRSLH